MLTLANRYHIPASDIACVPTADGAVEYHLPSHADARKYRTMQAATLACRRGALQMPRASPH